MPSYTEFSVGGGLLDDANVKFTNIEFMRFDYAGTADPVPALHALLVNIDTDEEVEQYWSCGSLEDWDPSDDGKELVQVGLKERLTESSNFVQLLVSLANAGFDKFADLEKDITMLEDMEAHVIRQKIERKGLKKKPREDGREFDMTVLVVDEILAAPWEKGKADKKTDSKDSKKATGKKTETSAKDDDIVAEAKTFVAAAIAEHGELQKKDLTQLALKDTELQNKNAIVKLMFKDDFLSSIEGVNFENGVLTAAE